MELMTITCGGDFLALHEKSCSACEGFDAPLDDAGMAPFAAELDPAWTIVDGHHLERVWEFSDFADALAFVNSAGAVCEEEWHHADFDFGWGRVQVTIWTHSVNGLTEADFVLACKLDQL